MSEEYIERRIATNAIGNIDTSKIWDDKDDIVEKAIAVVDHLPAADAEQVYKRGYERGKRDVASTLTNAIASYMAENAYLNDTALDALKMVAKWASEAADNRQQT